MTAALLALYVLGLAGAVAFVVLQRPRSWTRVEFLNGVGWVAVAGAGFLRGAVLLVLSGHAPHRTMTQDALSVGLLVLVDALVLLRLVSFLRWTRGRHRRPSP